MAKLNAGRLAAANALMAAEKGLFIDESLNKRKNAKNIEERDFRLAWNLAYGVLRNRGDLAYVLDKYLKKALFKQRVETRVSLLIGLYEIHYCRTPSRAAIDQAVELCRTLGCGFASGFVNAVLRRAKSEQLSSKPSRNLGPFLQEKLAQYDEWLNRSQNEPRVSVVTKDGKAVEFATEPAALDGKKINGVYYSALSGKPELWPHYEDGTWWIMDPSSAQVADLAYDVWSQQQASESLQPPQVLDVCAAPGGKSFRLSTYGATITATDSSLKRLNRLQNNASRLGIDLQIQQHDWTKPSDLPLYDVVIVDAPCSGTGVIRRHPEIRWRIEHSDILALTILQRQILRNAMLHVKPGGILVYSVCSVLSAEGRDVVSDVVPWKCLRQWENIPPKLHEDGFQAFVFRR